LNLLIVFIASKSNYWCIIELGAGSSGAKPMIAATLIERLPVLKQTACLGG
jgi:hypothetical protein